MLANEIHMVKNILLTLIVLLIVGGIGYMIFSALPASAPAEHGRLPVVTSFYPMYFFASEIAKDKADITNVTPVGTEPHDYEPTAQEVARIQRSKLLIVNGGNLETWVDKIKDQLGSSTLLIVAGEGLVNKTIEEDGEMIRDPHVWLSPPLAKQEAGAIAQGFERVDPANAAFYNANAQALGEKLAALHETYIEELRTCKLRDFVTSHAAFGYLADQYNLREIAITGVSPNEEPSAAKLAEIANLIKAKGIKYIFFESLVSPKLAQTLARETGAETLVLDPIEGLTDEEIREGKSYLTQMEMNLNNLKLALGCTT